MEEIKIKRNKGSDKTKRTHDKYGKFSQKAIRINQSKNDNSKAKR